MTATVNEFKPTSRAMGSLVEPLFTGSLIVPVRTWIVAPLWLAVGVSLAWVTLLGTEAV